MILWHPEHFHILTRQNEAMVARFGLVSSDGLWGLHLDGEHATLTHIPSGKRLWRFRSLGAAAQAVATLTTLPGVEWNTRKLMMDEPTETHILTIVKEADL